MPGAMRKLGLYLGLVEDDEDRDRRYDEGYDGADDEGYDDDHDSVPAGDSRSGGSVRRWTAEERPAARTAALHRDAPRTRGAVALEPGLRAAPVPEEPYRITTLHPRTYNEARTIGEHFRDGTPVIMNLTEMDDGDAKRLVDFAAGLIFGLRGSIERVTNKVFLLSPEHVEVTAEDKARIATGGFFNQS
jgi:cell division inhibitor SepF